MLHIIYMHVAPPEPPTIDFSLGNHNIYEMVKILNRYLLFRFTVAYVENADTL